MPNFKTFPFGEALPEGYRLATVNDVVQHGYGYEAIRGGKWVDVQDYGNDYFNYYCRPLDFDKTRLKDGFIDNRRKLAWRKFGGLCVVDKLAVATPPPSDRTFAYSDVKLYSSSSPNISDDDHRVVALLYACLEEEIDEIKDLVREHGKEIILLNLHGVPCGGNALHMCAWEGKIKSLEFLLKAIDKEAAAKAVGNQDGETPLLLAALRGYIQKGLAVKMLLQFNKTQINTASRVFGSTPLAMAISWSQSLEVCKDLLQVKEIEIEYRDRAGNTALHLAVQNSSLRGEINLAILELLLLHCGFESNSIILDIPREEQVLPLPNDFIKSIGRSNREVRNGRFKIIQGNKRRFVNIRNKIKETPLHHALAGMSSLPSASHMIVLKLVMMLIRAGAKIMKMDANGQTILHHVCKIKTTSKVETTIVRILQECSDSSEWLEYVRMQDIGGETALHKSAFSCNKDIVSIFLSFSSNVDNNQKESKKVKKLVHVRDFDGKTALHSAVMSKDANANDKMEIVKMLVEHAGTCENDSERFLLLWASAENLGTADELCTDEQSKELKNYLHEQRMSSKPESILETAYDLRRHDITVEMFNRDAGAGKLTFKGKQVVSKYEEKYKTITSDVPSSLDLLERKDITHAIATLLLNQRTGSPITIGIFGGTGMGKSSLMEQVQCRMLEMAAKATVGLSNDTQANHAAASSNNNQEGHNNISSAKEYWKCFRTSRSTKQLRHDVIKVVNRYELLKEKGSNEMENLEKILSTYKKEFSPILKRLAFGNKGNDSSRLQGPPALITVAYNASQYEQQDEAWAGLAVKISKEMVGSCMTAGQQLRISWLYAFKKNPQLFCINLILPTILTVFLGGFVGWLAWKLLSIPNNPLIKKFQYGSIPLSIFLVAWFVIKNILNEVKPVTQTLGSEYKSLSSMNVENLGLQNRVIEDIKFLQKEIYNPTSLLWIGIAFFWKYVTYFIAEEKSLESSDDLKSIPKKGTLRIVVFIDNLDRSKEQLLTPLNTILSACDINAVIAFDKRKIDKQHREGILRQLIQLPIVLPDPSVKQIRNHFLKDQLYIVGSQEKKNLELDLFADDEEDKETKMKEVTTNLMIFDMATTWDAHYTKVEIETFQHVAQHAYGEFRSPREWKSLLNYHRLVRSILSHSNRWNKVRLMKGWKRQLILWLFLCWQWKKPMNGIIKNWSSLVKVPPQLKSVYKENSSRMLAQISARSSSPTQRWLNSTQERIHLWRHDGSQPQRRNLKHQCSQQDKLKAIDEIHPTLKTILKSRLEQLSEECENPGQIRKSREECKMMYVKKETVEKLTHIFETDQSPQDKHEKRLKAWNNMEEMGRMIATLKKGRCDVKMSGILSFQEFRFDCKAGYLELPIPDSDSD